MTIHIACSLNASIVSFFHHCFKLPSLSYCLPVRKSNRRWKTHQFSEWQENTLEILSCYSWNLIQTLPLKQQESRFKKAESILVEFLQEIMFIIRASNQGLSWLSCICLWQLWWWYLIGIFNCILLLNKNKKKNIRWFKRNQKRKFSFCRILNI